MEATRVASATACAGLASGGNKALCMVKDVDTLCSGD